METGPHGARKVPRHLIEAVYPLSPLQQGMLFHSVYPGGDAAYHEQNVFRLRGALDAAALRRAWAALLAEHSVLRTAFVWQQTDRLLQVVLRSEGIELPWVEHDFSARDAAQQVEALRALLADDRRQGFELERAPLLRLALCELGAGEWYFVFSHHHLILDGWSVSLLLAALQRNYRRELDAERDAGAAAAAAAELDVAPDAGYARYIQWLGQRDRESARRFFRGQLPQPFELTPLPADLPERSTTSSAHAELELELDAELSAKIEVFARRERVTSNTVLQGAWALVLGRHAGRRQVVFGVTVAGRPPELPGAERWLGLFINSLPLRVLLPPALSIGAALRSIQDQSLALREFEYSALSDIQRWCDVSRLFDSLFVFDNFPRWGEPRATSSAERDARALTGAGLNETEKAMLASLGGKRNHYPLTLVVVPGSRLKLLLSHDTGRFSAERARLLLDNVQHVLRAFTAGGERALGDISPWGSAERRAPSDRAAASGSGLLEWVRRHARERPSEIAIESAQTRQDWQTLERESSRLAGVLERWGVSVETPVGLLLPRSEAWVNASLAILKAGGCYVPLDTAQPLARAAFCLDDSRCRFVIGDSAESPWAAQGVTAPRARYLSYAELSARARQTIAADAPATTAPSARPPHPDQLAYVIYTSGSGGQPKGVAITHGCIGAYTHAVTRRLAPDSGQRWAWLSGVAADLGNTGVFAALALGQTLCVVDDAALADPDRLSELSSAARADHLKVAPSQFRALFEAMRDPGPLVPRHTLVFGGERPSPAIVRRVRELQPGCRVFNHYGPTETTVGVICGALPAHGAEAAPGVEPSFALGTALEHSELWVLDGEGQPVADGATGELCVGGPALARGYLGRAALTAERFVPDPFAREPGRRLYRSGDRVWARAGEYHFLGRLDAQLKIHGQRIEPGEVEHWLASQPGVAAAAIRVGGSEHEPRLQAHLVPLAASELDLTALKARAARELPSHFLPSAWHVHERLPRLSSGKLDRRALEALEHTSHRREPVPPRSELEARLAQLWQTLLKRERVGVLDNFFELGGDSILSLQLVARARREGLTLTPKQVFEQPTIAELAVALSGASASQPAPEESEPRAPLSPIQRWFFEQPLDNPHHFNQSLLFALPSALSVSELERALGAVVERHPSLRSTFRPGAAGLEQLAGPPSPEPVLRVIELLGGEQHGDAARIEDICEQTQRALDFERGPVFRAVYFEAAPAADAGRGARGYLFLVAHHLVVDALSWRIVLDDLHAAYHGRELGPQPVSFASWARALERYAATGEAERELEHWLSLPRFPAPARDVVEVDANRYGRQLSCRVRLAARDTSALLEILPARLGTDVDDLVLAALVWVLGAESGADGVNLELEGHGRAAIAGIELDLSRTVGWFTTRYPIALQRDAALPLERYVRSIREQRRAVPQRGLGYGVLRYLHAAGERLRQQPAPEVAYNYLGQIDRGLAGDSWLGVSAERELTALGRGTERDPRGIRAQPLAINARIEAGELILDWLYARDVYRDDRVRAWADASIDFLEGSIRSLARDDASESWGLSPVERAELERAGAEQVYAAAPLQAGLLFHGLLGGGAYVNQLSLTLRGLEALELQRAWQELSVRHEVLRTRLCWELGAGSGRRALEKPVLVVERAVRVDFEPLDYRGLSAEEQERRWELELARDKQRGYALDRAPLWRVLLADLGEGRSRVLWSRHHVLMDGWSTAQLFDELLKSYRGEPLLERRPPFRRYIEWLSSRDPSQARDFWRRELRGVEVTALPGFGTGESAACGEGEEVRPLAAAVGRERLELSRERSERLRQWAARNGLTLNTLCQGAWGLLLARHAGAREVVFGVTVSGRPAELPGAERMLGLFINAVPLRLKLPGAARVVPWLSELQRRAAEQRQHESHPLHEIQAELGLGGRGSFDSLLVFENYPLDAGLARSVNGLTLERAEARDDTHYGLTLVVLPGECLKLELQYACRLYDQAQGQQLLEQYLDVLCALLEAEHVGEVGLGGVLANGGASPIDPELVASGEPLGTLTQAFERRVAQNGDAEALVDGVERLSYRQLWRRAEALAQALWLRGVTLEERVGLCLGRSSRQVAAMLGVLKAGGCYVPMEPSLPRARRELMLRDAGCRLLVTDRESWEGEPVAGVERLDWEDLEANGSRHTPSDSRHRADRRPRPSADNLAYVIYTSGSTGTPKGVGISHGQVLRLFRTSERHYGFSSADVWTLFHSYAFDVSVWELWGALLYGGRLVVVPAGTARDPSAYLELLERERVTLLNETPSAFYELSQQVLRASGGSDAGGRLRDVRLVIFAGEALDLTRMREWMARYPDTRPELINMYGTTETTVHASYRRITAADVASGAFDAARSPVGIALGDLSLRVLDRERNPQPPGALGEVYIGGAGVGRGYLGRPALTAARFVPDPSGAPGSRRYRTGDRARLDERGQLEFFGRLDEQIQLRGHRIELGEIAAQLEQHPELARAEVRLLELGAGPQLVAYLQRRQASAGEALSPSESARHYREHLARVLPDYMLPSHFIVLERFPLNQNGKLDRARLPLPELTAASDEAPRGPLQAELAAIWKELLGVEVPSIRQSFFELGGHSLLAVRLLTRLRSRYAREISLSQLFQQPTIAGLSELLADPSGALAADTTQRLSALLESLEAAEGRHERKGEK